MRQNAKDNQYALKILINSTLNTINIIVKHNKSFAAVYAISNRHGVDTDNPSVECATLIHDLSDNDRLYFASIQKNSVLVDDDLYTWAKIWISKQEVKPAVMDGHEIDDQMYRKKAFLISALPMSRTMDELAQCYFDIENNNAIENTEMRNCAFHDIANYSIPMGLSADEFHSRL